MCARQSDENLHLVENNENSVETEGTLISEEENENTHPEYRHWRLQRDDQEIVWLYADNGDSSTNVLSAAVLDELDAILAQLEADKPKGLVVLSEKPNGFFAGADIKEFTTLKNESEAEALIQRGQLVCNRLEAQSYPTVALIHGFCLGGGMELALACRYRIADDDPATKLGLPEVKLGIHPGFGGIGRITPLTGAPVAMDILLTGRMLSARASKKLGLIDYAVPTRQLHYSAITTVLKPPPRAKAKGWKAWTNHALVRPILAPYLRKQVAKKAPKEHYPAPYAIIDLWHNYADNSQRLMVEERASLARLAVSETARNLVRVFFLQERVKSLGRRKDYAPKTVHVIGAGVMGGDIAAWCALSGLQVTLQDRQHQNIAKVLQRAHKLFTKKLKQPRVVQAAMDRLVPDMSGQGLAKADVIIEAIFEDIDAKQTLYREIEPIIRGDALLATNTSSIPLQTLGEALSQPERLVGLHFFNPVAQMQLVEIVSSEQTDSHVVDTAAAFAHFISRLPVPVKSTPGFLVNRVLMPYLLEAVVLEASGVPAVAIDKAAVKFGMPMGPIHLADSVGLDICLSVAEILAKEIGGEVPQRLRNLVSAGYLGVKTGRGFYIYKNRKPELPKLDATYTPPADLIDRMMFRLFNECVACLREGVVEDADLLDTGVIFGTGFAPFRGGPINYLKSSGVESMHAKIKELASKHGDRFKEDAGWADLQSSNT